MSKSTDHTDPIAETRQRALGVRRPAESWIDDDVDFDVQSVRSRTIELSASKTDAGEPEGDKKRLPKVPSIPRPTIPNVSMPAIPTNTVDLVHGSAAQIDKAAGKVAEKAKDVGDKSADVARVGAEKVNEKRRAGLPPGRDHERRNKPRVAKIAAERRPRKKAADRVGPRPDRIVLWAVILGFVLIFIAATSSSKAATAQKLGDRELHTGMRGHDVRILHRKLKTGGFYTAKITSIYTKKTRTGVRKYQKSRCIKADGVAGKQTIKAIRTRMAACGKAATAPVVAPTGPELGYRVLSPGATGDDVRVLQKLLNIAQTSVYDATTVATVKGYQSGAGIAADGVAGPQTLNAIGNAQPAYKSTWYGPGFFGNTTACGQTLTTATVGVAHKTLACGTEVILFYKGKFKKATVIDRGPYANGAVWDLTQATAQAVGLMATDMVHAKY